MQDSLDIKFEKGVRMLAQYFPVSQKNSRKPILFHDIRVGVYLHEKEYSRDIILAGLMHDALEFSEITEQMIQGEFGENVVRIVKACTKDRTIENSDKRIEELVERCVANGQEALIVKVADTLDSFKHYTKENNQGELEYCRKNAKAILKYKPDNFDDEIFDELVKWLEK